MKSFDMLIREANYFLSCMADTFSSGHTEHVFSVEGSCLQPLFWKLCERPMFHSGWLRSISASKSKLSLPPVLVLLL